jgi:hypothetical protein
MLAAMAWRTAAQRAIRTNTTYSPSMHTPFAKIYSAVREPGPTSAGSDPLSRCSRALAAFPALPALSPCPKKVI